MLFLQSTDEIDESICELWIELRASPRPDLFERVLDRPSGRVRTAMCESVEDVGQRDNSRKSSSSNGSRIRFAGFSPTPKLTVTETPSPSPTGAT